MKIKTLKIEGLKVITPRLFKDNRGYFMESYNHDKWKEELGVDFVQDNESKSKKGVLRALHFQNPPFAQDKLVRVISGSVLDVAVDLRKSSPTYGQHCSVILSAENKKQFFIPKGFAHGFLALEENTVFSYKCSDYYHAEAEESIIWNDEILNIDWNTVNPVLSSRDASSQKFSTFESKFL